MEKMLARKSHLFDKEISRNQTILSIVKGLLKVISISVIVFSLNIFERVTSKKLENLILINLVFNSCKLIFT